MFEHTFQHALFGVGALLAFSGVIFAIANGTTSLSAGVAESLSYGFASFFLALFSGALIGVGIAMATDSLILGLRGNRAHVAVTAIFSLLSLLIAASSVFQPETSSFHLFVLFFAGLSASGAFMLSAALFGFSALFHSFAVHSGAVPSPALGQSLGKRAAEKQQARRGSSGNS